MKMKKTKQRGAHQRSSSHARREERRVDPTHHPDLEPQHDQPWIPTSGLIDRIRRSPRQ